jgi:peptide/nickel transport system ATP-binding protein
MTRLADNPVKPPAVATATRPLVEADRLTRYFDVSKPWLNRVIEREPRQYLRAVNEVSFAIEAGETFALVGESGCGKSTVARLMVDLLTPSAGTVRFDGADLGASRSRTEERALRRRVQMVFQDPYASLNPRWRVRDIVYEPIRAFGLATSRAEVADQIGGLLRKVGLDPADGHKYPHEFSGGQRQRIAIARALSSRPEFIVFDEPTSALDVSVQAQILNLMRDLQDEFGLTYLFISHDLAVVRHMAKRIGVMYLGELVEVSPSRDLFAAPRHPYTRMLIAAVPDIHMTGRARDAVKGEVPNPIDPPPGCSFHPRCPFAFERCPVETPQLKPAGQARVAACHAVEEGRIFSDDDLARIGFDPAKPAADLAVSLARLAQACGLDGVVCSAVDLAAVRTACGPDFLTVVPGLRPSDGEAGDQKRIATPAEARAAGADILVIGRPITGAADPARAARDILASLQERS